MCSAVMQHLGGEKTQLDAIVNAAGAIFDGDAENTFPQDYDYIVDLNLRSIFHITTLLAGFLEKTNGCIVNVSSSFGNRPKAGAMSYCMSKAGLEMLTKCCALELAPLGIRVNAVAPGTTNTNLLRYAGYSESEYEAYKERVIPLVPLQKIATPEQIAKSIIFLCSPK
jgi:NAD(P)-dependent dehydrogenase (short-subunit alcohol dehydrogenase family)